MKKRIGTLLLFIVLLCTSTLFAQNNAYTSYIAKYHRLAQQHMHKYNIPASITLAQALLESGAGRSTLATKANNHFGIKATGNWTGPYICRDDDRPNERFRKYKDPKESYEDHSRFLLKPRYASLFTYSTTDYKNWAKGLKRAGYATNAHYAQHLIQLIESYRLYEYDTPQRHKKKKPTDNLSLADLPQMGICNNCRYVIARAGDSYASLALQFNLWEKQLRKYNEAPAHMELQGGEIVYIQKKKRHVAHSYRGKYHVVSAGQSLHHIAQLYGVRLKTLIKANHLPQGYQLKIGDKIKLS